MTGQSWLLGGGYPWRSADLGRDPDPIEAAVVANDREGLSLAPLADGPWGVESRDGSLGRLTVPRGVATWGDVVVVLSENGDRVWRYDPVGQRAMPLSEIGMDGLCPPFACNAHLEPRRFRRAAGIALFDSWLYVADPEAHRVQVFDLETLALVRVHAVDDPVDVAAGTGGVGWVNRARGRVYLDHPSLPAPRVVVRAPYRAGRWDRLAIDRAGRLYLRDTGSLPPGLDVFDAPGRRGRAKPLGRVRHAAQVRDRFTTPPVHSDLEGGLMLDPRRLDPCGLRAATGSPWPSWTVNGLHYTIDRDARAVLVTLPDGRTRHRFGPQDAAGIRVAADAPDAWRPMDAVVLDGRLLVLDAAHQHVLEHRAGDGALRHRVSAPDGHPRRWSRIGTDGKGCLLLWDGGPTVDRVDREGRLIGERPARDAQRFLAPPAAEAAPDEFSLRIDRDGVSRVGPAGPAPWPAPAYERRGVWISQWLDSGIYECQWDSVTLTLGALPPGATVDVRTRTTGDVPTGTDPLPPLAALAALGSWSQPVRLVGEAQPLDAKPPEPIDVLVSSPSGRHLQVLVELSGDGRRGPVLASVRTRFPRESWLQYLPAVYSQPEEQRGFLDRYLAIAQATWSQIEGEVDSFERYLDPRSTPVEALPYLAKWLDLQLEGSLTADQHRRLMQALPAVWMRWGTITGLRDWVRVHLSVLSGLEPEVVAAAGMPGIVERFVERRHVLLQPGGTHQAWVPQALWSPLVERRFQVGVFDREGEVEIVSHGHPDEDVFRHYAHAFRVYVPAAWVATPAAQALLRRAIDLQRPAHTTFSLVMVEPRLRIGDQSTLDLDCVIGGDLPSRLGGCGESGAAAGASGGRLGYDTTLGGSRPAWIAGTPLG